VQSYTPPEHKNFSIGTKIGLVWIAGIFTGDTHPWQRDERIPGFAVDLMFYAIISRVFRHKYCPLME